MKDWLRLAVVLLSMPVAWFATGWLTRFTLSGPLPSGGFEGTPATILVQPIVLVVTLGLSVLGGLLALEAYFRRDGL